MLLATVGLVALPVAGEVDGEASAKPGWTRERLPRLVRIGSRAQHARNWPTRRAAPWLCPQSAAEVMSPHLVTAAQRPRRGRTYGQRIIAVRYGNPKSGPSRVHRRVVSATLVDLTQE